MYSSNDIYDINRSNSSNDIYDINIYDKYLWYIVVMIFMI